MKKSLRVLFVLIFLLSLGSLSVQAQGAPTALAYLPLLPHSAGSVSPEASSMAQMHLLARQAYARLAPALMQAQKNGQVLRFAPDLSAGLVMVEYVAGTDLASLLGSGQPVFATPQAVLEYTQAGQAMKNVLSTPAGPYFFLYQNYCEFFGGNLGARNDTYKAYLKDASGRLVGDTWGTLNDSGGFNNCFGGLWGGISPGFSFTFKVFTPDGIGLLHTYTTAIPSLAVSSISPATKIARGTAPAGSQLTISLSHPKLDSKTNVVTTNKTTTTTGAGAWQVNFGLAAMRGGDRVDVVWSKPSSIFTFGSFLDAPFVECALSGNWCQITGSPAALATLFFKHGGSTFTYTGKFDVTGSFGANLVDAHMHPIFLKAGDQVGGTGVSTLTLPSLTALPDYVLTSVTGTAPADRWFEVDLERYRYADDWWRSYDAWVHSNGYGDYSTGFFGLDNITTTDRLKIGVYYYDPATGNQTSYQKMITP